MTGHMGDGTFGEGDFGGVPAENPLHLHIISKTSLTVKLGWTPPPAIDYDGYQFLRNGVAVSRTFNKTLNTATMSYKAGDRVGVRAIKFTNMYEQTVKP